METYSSRLLSLSRSHLAASLEDIGHSATFCFLLKTLEQSLQSDPRDKMCLKLLLIELPFPSRFEAAPSPAWLQGMIMILAASPGLLHPDRLPPSHLPLCRLFSHPFSVHRLYLNVWF